MERVLSSALIAGLVAAVLLVAISRLRGGGSPARSWSGFLSYSSPEDRFGWLGPALVIYAAYEANILVIQSEEWWLPLTIYASAGAVSALLSFGLLKPLRDSFLSIASVFLILVSFRSMWTDPGSGILSTAMLLLLAVAFLFGVLLNILRVFTVPALGLGALGAIEIVQFLSSPFGVSLVEEVPIEGQLVVWVVAAVVGFGAAIAPNLIVGLAVLAITVAEVSLKGLLWFSSQGTVPLDWYGAVLLLAVVAGYGLVRELKSRFW